MQPPTVLKAIASFFLFSLLLLFPLTLLAQLNADFSVDKSGGCSPLVVSFTNKTTGATVNAIYQWDFGNGNTSTMQNPGAVYNEEKTYTITLTVVDGAQTSVKKQIITVYKKPTVDFAPSISKVCLPSPVTFTTSTTAGDGFISNYFWDFGDGSTQQAYSGQVTHSFGFTQKPAVSVTVTNSYGCSASTTRTNILEVLPSIQAGFTTDKNILCQISDAVQFTNSSSGPGTLTYAWDFGDGGTSTQKNPAHIYNSKGTYTVKMTVSNTDGCSATNVQTASINVANFNTDITIPTLICRYNYLTFNSTSTISPNNCQWDFGDGGTDYYGWTSASHIYNNSGAYAIKLVNSYGACKDTVIRQITVNDIPNLKGFIISSYSLCGAPVTVQFKDTTADAVKWQWQFDYYNTSSVQAPSFTFNSDGNYYVGLTVSNTAGCSSYASKSVYIAKPAVSISYINSSSPNGNSSCGPLTLTFVANSSEALTTYNWDFGDGTTSNEVKPQHTFSTPGTYIIKLSYTTINGCKGVVDYSAVHVYSKPNADFTSSVTTACGPSMVDFAGISSSPVTNWYWNFGDNPYGYYTSQYPRHGYSDTGTYSIQLIAINGTCSDTVIKQNYIKVVGPFPRINNVTNTCDGTRGTITITQATRLATGGTWNFGDGTTAQFDPTQATINHTYTKSGYYTVTLTATAGQCSVSAYTTVFILLKQKPSLTLSKTGFCSDESVNVTISNYEKNPHIADLNSPNYSFQFKYGDGSNFNVYTSYYGWSNVYNGSISGFAKGQDKIRVITTSAYFGCNDTSDYVPIKVKGANAGFEIVNNNLCFKGPIQFKDTSKSYSDVPISSWQWGFGDGQSLTLTNGGLIAHQYTNPGNYYVTLRVIDASGCSSSTSSYYNNVQVSGPKAAFSISASTISPNTTEYFYNYTNIYNAGNVTYNWDYGDGVTSTFFNGSHVYTVPGTYKIRLIASSPTGCTDTTSQSIIVKYVNSAFNFSSTPITSNGCPPVVVRFVNTSYNASRFTWDFGDGSTLDNQYYPSHVYYKPGKYYITLTTFSDNGTKYVTVDSVNIISPVAAMKADVLSGCTSQQITLSTVAQNTNSYTWDFGDGAIIKSKDTFSVHQFLTAGVYTPSLITTSAGGCSSLTSLSDKIIIDSLHITIKGIPGHICDSALILFQPDVVSLAADQAQQPLNYSWDFGTGNPADIATIKNPSFNYNRPGLYTVSFKVSSPYGCIKQTSEKLTVYQRAKGAISGPVQICEASFAQFKGNASITDTVEWNWDFNNGNTAIVEDPSQQQFITPDTYAIQLVTKHDGCYDTTISKLVVNPNPVIALSASRTQLCLGESVQLSASGGNTYSWTPQNSLDNAVIATPVAKPVQSTTYSVMVTNNFGCTKTDSLKLTVIQPFTLIAVTDTFVCKGSSIQLNVRGASSYQWINDIAGLDNAQTGNPLASPQSNTSYTVVGSDAYGCFKDTAMINVAVKQLPTVAVEPSLTMFTGDEHQLITKASNDVTQWLWSPGNYLSCTYCASPVITPKQPITYVVSVKNKYGCTAYDTIQVKLQCGQAYIFIPNSFTPGNDGKNDVFYIKGKGVSTIKYLRIFNRWGELVFERTNFEIDDKSAAWDGKYKGNLVPPGSYVYIAEMRCDTGEPFIRKGTITVIY